MRRAIVCGWCAKAMPRAAGVAADSHGMCSTCAAEWRLDPATKDRTTKRRDAIAQFEIWRWTVAKARRFHAQARRVQLEAA